MKLRVMFEMEGIHALTHEVMTHHGYEKKWHNVGWFHSNPRQLNMSSLHNDLKGVGWKYNDNIRQDYRFQTHSYTNGSQKLKIEHEVQTFANPHYVISSGAVIW